MSFYLFKAEKVQSIVPYYYFPTIKNLQKESISIGASAYQLLYLGQYEESLNLAKLALQINKTDEKLWLILSEAQVANKLYKNALNSLNQAQKINSNNSEIYFAKSNVYLKISQLQKAKTALKAGLKILSAYFKANPHCFTAVNTTSLSFFNSSDTNSSINPYFLRDAKTISRSSFKDSGTS